MKNSIVLAFAMCALAALRLDVQACVDGHDERHAGTIRDVQDSFHGDQFMAETSAEDEAYTETFKKRLDEEALLSPKSTQDDESLEGCKKHRHRHRHHREKKGLSLIESIFAAQPSRVSAKESLRFLTETPHMAGTKQDEILGRWMVRRFKELGADASWVDPIDAFLSFPRQQPRLALLSSKDESKVEYEARLSEDVLDNDATSDTWYRNHTFNGYSPSAKVKGKMVYANFGTPEDFAVLERFNISVKNRIVLVRYGKCFRGLKAMNAQQRGAIGVVIFSDPHEDGYSVGPAYPQGPWRPASAVQRGSVQFNSLCAGDPRRAATNNTFEKCGYLPRDLYPKIPVLPISYEDATPFLKNLRGPFSPPEFVGSLQVAYKLGPSESEIYMETKNRYSIEKIWNAFAVFKGPHWGKPRDRPLVIGNHRDAWVFGGFDSL